MVYRWHNMLWEDAEDKDRSGRPGNVTFWQNVKRLRDILNSDWRLSVRMLRSPEKAPKQSETRQEEYHHHLVFSSWKRTFAHRLQCDGALRETLCGNTILTAVLRGLGTIRTSCPRGLRRNSRATILSLSTSVKHVKVLRCNFYLC